MAKAGYVYHPIYLQHDTGQHVERAGRLEAIISHLEETGLTRQLTAIEPRAATTEELELVHHAGYIDVIRRMADEGGGWLDSDTVMSAGSYRAATYAAGGAVKAVDAVLGGEVAGAFALVRPPGHHATAVKAMGFCLFNSIAIAAKYALKRHRLERIAIVDFDVHHGNSTHDVFYHDSQVLYVSVHQKSFYPGTGDVGETGEGEGAGTTVNIPLPAGCGDAQYADVFTRIIAPVVRRFAPQLIMVSAGYDPHWADQLAMMNVTASGFAAMVKDLKGWADELCGGRLVFSLEGGYHLRSLATSVAATFDALLGNDIQDPLGTPPDPETPDIAPLVETVRKTHRLD